MNYSPSILLLHGSYVLYFSTSREKRGCMSTSRFSNRYSLKKNYRPKIAKLTIPSWHRKSRAAWRRVGSVAKTDARAADRTACFSLPPVIENRNLERSLRPITRVLIAVFAGHENTTQAARCVTLKRAMWIVAENLKATFFQLYK